MTVDHIGKKTGKKNFLDEFAVLGDLSSNFKCNVKLVKESSSGKLFAAKIVKKFSEGQSEEAEALMNEARIIALINHPHVVHLHKFVNSGVLTDGGQSQRVSYLLLEYAQNGEVFELLRKADKLSENAVKFISLQLLRTLSQLHERGIAHRDIKLENMLLDSVCKLKLIDFGFSTRRLLGKISDTYLGSEGYLAPELIDQKPYDIFKADIFSAGVVVFSLAVGHPPFVKASITDPFYKAFVLAPSKFWKQHSKRIGGDISEELRFFITGMLAPDPSQRFSASQALQVPWLQESLDTLLAEAELQKKARPPFSPRTLLK